MHENVDELLEGRVTSPTPPSQQQFISGTVPYGPGSFGSSYPYDGPSTSTTTANNSTYRNTFTSFPTCQQPVPVPIHQQLSHLRAPHHPALNRFLLPNHEYVTCVLWNGLYHISGKDIVRALVFRFEAFGRPVRNMKKFEEGIYSDLRNLKPGVDASLEEPKSLFLNFLFKYQCIRTQMKQKVFYWFSVPHDRLFLDALERDLKLEKMGLEPTTQIVGEPALSFTYDAKKTLYEQFSKAQAVREGEGDLEKAARRGGAPEDGENATHGGGYAGPGFGSANNPSGGAYPPGMGVDTGAEGSGGGGGAEMNLPVGPNV